MLIDITGPIYEGMWGNGAPFPSVTVRPVPQPPWVKKKVYCEIFDGMNSQTGTYLETPAHWFGEESYPLTALTLDRITDVPCTVLKLDHETYTTGGRVMITKEALCAAIEKAGSIAPDTAILVVCGWGKYWRDATFQKCAPYFSYDAMQTLISLHPRILASDSPAWECRENPQNFFADFYAADILMLAPAVVPDNLPDTPCTLTALPIPVEGTSCAPCRAFLRF